MPGARTWRAADSILDQAEHKQCQDRLRDNLTAAGAPATNARACPGRSSVVNRYQ